MRRFILTILFTSSLFTYSKSIQAQTAPSKQWDKTLGGSNNESLSYLKQTTDGGYILAGSSDSGVSSDKTAANKGSFDYWVVKLDPNGSKLWDKTFGGSGHEYLRTILQCPDGGYIIGGSSSSGSSGDRTQTSKGLEDIWVVKLDANGNKLWDKAYGGSDNDYLNSIDLTSDGGYILGGPSSSGISGDKTQGSQGWDDCWVVKIDQNGNVLWDRTIGGSNSDQLISVKETIDGGFIIGSHSSSGISGDKTHANKGVSDYWVIKLNSNGYKLWDKTFGGTNGDLLYSLGLTTDGGYILGGHSISYIGGDKSQDPKGSGDFWVVRIDSSGIKVWDKTIGGSSDDRLFDLQQTSDGGFILGGDSQSNISGDKSQNSRGNWDYWIVKIDTAGNKIWDVTLGGSGIDHLWSLQQTLSGGYIFGGESNSAISLDKTQASRGASDFWVIKLGTNISGISDTLTTGINIYPNPTTNNSVTISYYLKNQEAVSIEVLDALGRVVKVVADNEIQVPGSYSYSFVHEDLKADNGVYTIRFIHNGSVSYCKLIIMR